MKKTKSECCNAEMRVAGDTTKWYECVQCGNPTDPSKDVRTKSELEKELNKLIDKEIKDRSPEGALWAFRYTTLLKDWTNANYVPKNEECTFCVITGVPRVDGTEETDGNLYDAFAVELGGKLYIWDSGLEDKFTEQREKPALQIQAPVFQLGEILLLDGTGREVGGSQRKPSKWIISYEEFNDAETAIKRSIEVTKAKYLNIKHK